MKLYELVDKLSKLPQGYDVYVCADEPRSDMLAKGVDVIAFPAEQIGNNEVETVVEEERTEDGDYRFAVCIWNA